VALAALGEAARKGDSAPEHTAPLPVFPDSKPANVGRLRPDRAGLPLSHVPARE
jgi:hypothetical protein